MVHCAVVFHDQICQRIVFVQLGDDRNQLPCPGSEILESIQIDEPGDTILRLLHRDVIGGLLYRSDGQHLDGAAGGNQIVTVRDRIACGLDDPGGRRVLVDGACIDGVALVLLKAAGDLRRGDGISIEFACGGADIH